jgi:UDP-glucose 4-epimerase
MTWLITGGAGYIGSHVVKILSGSDINCIVFDDLSTGNRSRVPKNVELIVGSITDNSSVLNVFKRNLIEGVIHLAGKKSVAESFQKQSLYHEVNVNGTKNILDACNIYSVKKVIFSSTAAVYAPSSQGDLLNEDSPLQPNNPYGDSKMISEQILKDFSESENNNVVVFRYFNVVGASNAVLAETEGLNLLPALRKSIITKEPFKVYGKNFPTLDGTCIRDYIHVEDVARAHLLAIKKLGSKSFQEFSVYNLGRGEGISVLQVIGKIERLLGQPIKIEFTKQRSGDMPITVCNTDKIKTDLGWTAQIDPFDGLNFILDFKTILKSES